MLGRASLQRAKSPGARPKQAKRSVVVGDAAVWPGNCGSPATMSRLLESRKQLGGKITELDTQKPHSRGGWSSMKSRGWPEILPDTNRPGADPAGFCQTQKRSWHFVVIAAGAQSPRKLPVPGMDRTIARARFCGKASSIAQTQARRLSLSAPAMSAVSAATEAFRLGAESVTLIDVQRQRYQGGGETAICRSSKRFVFLWPRIAKAVTDSGVGPDVRRCAARRPGHRGDQANCRTYLPAGRNCDRARFCAGGHCTPPATPVLRHRRCGAAGSFNRALHRRELESPRGRPSTIRSGAHESYDKLPPDFSRDRVKAQYFDPRAAGMNDPRI